MGHPTPGSSFDGSSFDREPGGQNRGIGGARLESTRSCSGFPHHTAMPPALPPLPAEVPAPVCSAFMHWTYHASGGRLVVADLQGWYDESSRVYRLTDPAVLCSEIGLFDDAETKDWWLVRPCRPACRPGCVTAIILRQAWYGHEHAARRGVGVLCVHSEPPLPPAPPPQKTHDLTFAHVRRASNLHPTQP